jgi:hypothetical protein
MDMYMELSTGIHTKHGNSKDHILKLLINIYGQKQAGCVWNSYLDTKLREMNFKQSLIDDCVFYRDDVIFIVYVAEMTGDIMYLHQALHQPDVREFVEAVIKEVNGHIGNDHWKLIPRTESTRRH